ncbi:MAG TPA: aminotransferase class V-fold PLP-dependent enzyme, partial [Alphaproteobacteria bacterium]|nr:aminotransferase class V-fold PLP-dependent enzyme [Alphaproteobacteria bacterium]
MAALGVHFLTLSSHKLGGPQGVGALVLGQCGETPVLVQGGGQEKKARAGTENVAGVAGFGLAAELAARDLDFEFSRLSALRDTFERRVVEACPAVTIHGAGQPRLPGTSLFSLPGLKAETLLMALDLSGFCVSNGSACTSGKVEASHVLAAMGVPTDIARAALRVSMGFGTQVDEVDSFLAALQNCAPVDKIARAS